MASEPRNLFKKTFLVRYLFKLPSFGECKHTQLLKCFDLIKRKIYLGLGVHVCAEKGDALVSKRWVRVSFDAKKMSKIYMRNSFLTIPRHDSKTVYFAMFAENSRYRWKFCSANRNICCRNCRSFANIKFNLVSTCRWTHFFSAIRWQVEHKDC